MSDSEIQAHIARANASPHPDVVDLCPLSAEVSTAQVWDRVGANRYGPRSFYFIRSREGPFVAAVYDAKGDLHWYVEPAYRERSLMSNALRRTILPYLARERAVQSITIHRWIGEVAFAASERLALRLGFLPGPQDDEVARYHLDLATYRGGDRTTARRTSGSV